MSVLFVQTGIGVKEGEGGVKKIQGYLESLQQDPLEFGTSPALLGME